MAIYVSGHAGAPRITAENGHLSIWSRWRPRNHCCQDGHLSIWSCQRTRNHCCQDGLDEGDIKQLLEDGDVLQAGNLDHGLTDRQTLLQSYTVA
jgi:hypothetical protein